MNKRNESARRRTLFLHKPRVQLDVDDSSFISGGHAIENEILVAMPVGKRLLMPKAWVTVVYRGETYRYQDRNALFEAVGRGDGNGGSLL